MSRNKWGTKLNTKLSILLDTSSKESFQGVSKWIAFHRKHSDVFLRVLQDFPKPSIVLKVLNELLVQNKENAERWDRLSDLREAIGEVILKRFDSKQVEEYLSEWDTYNVFGGPALLNRIKRKDSKPKTPPKGEQKSPPKPPSPPVAEEEANPKPVVRKESSNLSYDFENCGVPKSYVDPKAFVDPCRNIATLQIARDLRSDSSNVCSSLLQNLPAVVREFVAEAAESNKEMDDDTAMEFSKIVSDELLDLDMKEQLQAVQMLRDLIHRQRAERFKLVKLLQVSRCDFGADDVAKAYYSVDMSKLEKRQQILADAMELEGYDDEMNVKDDLQEEEELPDLAWYTEAAAKRQKLS